MRSDDRPRHQMRVGKFALPRGGPMLIDQPPVFIDHLHRHHALAGGDGIVRLAAMFSAMRSAGPRKCTT